MKNGEFSAWLRQHSSLIDKSLEDLLRPRLPKKLPSGVAKLFKLNEAVKYTLLGGGKRFRGLLSLASAEAVGGNALQGMPAALAIELIHGYAIIHDDLPALDDDFLRRGRPSSHAAFGEATAILAGDLLQSMAFQILSEPPEEGRFDPAARLRAINCLSRGCGLYGLAGGQYLDHDLDRGSSASIGEVIGMHLLKTGNIFAAAMAMGGILAGADPQGEMALSLVGSTAGVAFQLRSDLLSQSKKGPLEDGAPSHKKTKASSIAASEAVEVRDFIQGQLQFAIERAKEFKCEKLELLLLHIFGS